MSVNLTPGTPLKRKKMLNPLIYKDFLNLVRRLQYVERRLLRSSLTSLGHLGQQLLGSNSMKLFSLTRIAAALAVGLLGAGAASADVIVTGASAAATNNSAVYVGAYNPTTSDNGTFTHAGLGGSGNPAVGSPFSDWWVFSISPAGLAAINATFILTGNISQFALDLYSLPSSAATYGCTTIGVACTTAGAVTSLTTASAQFLSGPNNAASFVVNMPSTFLDVGTYAFHISGLSSAPTNTSPNSYSGNISVSAPIPEPGSLALVAAGLLAAGAVARRRSSK